MTRMILSMGIVLVALTYPQRATAECAYFTLTQAMNLSDLALLGVARGAQSSTITIDVEQLWKGTTAKRVELYTDASIFGGAKTASPLSLVCSGTLRGGRGADRPSEAEISEVVRGRFRP